jgi:predicted SAM-dependent methyltransferase
MDMYVQYGCGLSAPEKWSNFDSSPSLKLQKLPLIKKIAKKKVIFPNNVLYGDIIKGLPGIKDNSCSGVYCSHVLEHLSLNDFTVALKNTYSILKPNGIFRCVLPDLEFNIKEYIQQKEINDPDASLKFMENTMLGVIRRPRSLSDKIINSWGNSKHLWMWDAASLNKYLLAAGFKSIRQCSFNDSTDPMFADVEEQGRFYGAIAFECKR